MKKTYICFGVLTEEVKKLKGRNGEIIFKEEIGREVKIVETEDKRHYDAGVKWAKSIGFKELQEMVFNPSVDINDALDFTKALNI